jgi:septum formation protein
MLQMLQADAPPLILASASAARRAVLAGAGLHFAVRPAAIDEAAIKHAAQSEGLDATTAALRLADAKAAWVARQEPQALVIGADQILVCDGMWYDKPEDPAAARRQLLALRNRTHELVTAVVCRTGDRLLWQHVAQPRLTMRAFSQTFLDAYLAVEGDRVLGSVGAYRLEGPGVQLFACVDGDHATILGLPLLPLLEFLRSAGFVLT